MGESESQEISSEKTRVGFPSVPEKKKSFNFKTLLIFLILLLLIGGGAWFLLIRNSGETIGELSPTPTVEVVEETPTPTEAEVNKEDISFQILNGSGVPGAAGKLQSALEALGYSKFEVGNADSYTYKATVVTFDTSLPESTKEEITEELEKIYSSVETNEKSLDKYDVSIIIGLPKGQTPTVTSRATISISPTPSPRLSGTGAGTITPTKTPTVTPTPTQ